MWAGFAFGYNPACKVAHFGAFLHLKECRHPVNVVVRKIKSVVS